MTSRLPTFQAIASGLLLSAVIAGTAHGLADKRDFNAMFSALNDLMQFAAPGRTVTWKNPVTGNAGDVTAVRNSPSGGRNCWDYRRAYFDAGKKLEIDGLACEIAPGLWEIQNEGASRAAAPPAAPAKPKAVAQPAKPKYDKAVVRDVQAMLTDLGYDPGPIDGAFGRRTGNAIKAFERDAGLKQIGKPSADMRERLRAAIDSRPKRQAPATTIGETVEPETQAPPTPVAKTTEPETAPVATAASKTESTFTDGVVKVSPGGETSQGGDLSVSAPAVPGGDLVIPPAPALPPSD